MIVCFSDLTERTRQAAFQMFEDWPDDQHTSEVVERVLTMACSITLPHLNKVDGDWVMQMMWQVPDLLENSTYSDAMDVNATVRTAVEIKIGDLIRDDVAERAVELGLDPGRMKI